MGIGRWLAFRSPFPGRGTLTQRASEETGWFSPHPVLLASLTGAGFWWVQERGEVTSQHGPHCPLPLPAALAAGFHFLIIFFFCLLDFTVCSISSQLFLFVLCPIQTVAGGNSQDAYWLPQKLSQGRGQWWVQPLESFWKAPKWLSAPQFTGY